MERILPGADFFESKEPAAAGWPHLVTALDAELIGKVKHLTGGRLGLWDVPAPFDEEDRFDLTREVTPFDAWALPLNQGEILAFSLFVQESVFASNTMFVDCAFDQTVLRRLAVTPGHRLEGGGWVTRGYQDLPELGDLVEQCGWALIPVGPERSLALFVASRAQAAWIAKLEEWCDHDGRSRGQFRLDAPGLRLVLRPAPDGYRQNAIDHQVDLFLSRLETYFGSLEQAVPDIVAARIESRRELRQRIAAARPPPLTG
jgi:hypothetical protein